MAVANTAYSTNSYKVTCTNELNSNTMIEGVNTAITTLGWSLYDSVNQTTYSPMVTRVYRVLNTDGTTYKYAIIRYNTLKLNFNFSACESWNTTTKVPTNETWHNLGCFYQGYDIRDGFIFVSATARHLILQPFIRNEPGLWTGIFEFERIAQEDIGSNSVPCFAYTNSLMLGTPWGQTSNNTPSRYMYAFPRTADGQTGAFAAKIYSPVTTRGMYPPYYPSANTGNTGANSVIIVNTHDSNALHLGSFYNTIGAWGWDASKAVVAPITVDHIYKSMPFGRQYNSAITKPIGSQTLDSTFLNADATGGWPSAGGSNTEFLVFPLNGGSETEFANTTGRLGISFSNNFNNVYSSVVAVGNNVWVASNTGVYTWDMGAGANTLPTARYLNTNGVIDIMFDGMRSIWGTTNNGIIQIDTETYATNVNVAADLGTTVLDMDQKYIYAASRNSNVQPKTYLFWRANANLAAHMNVGSALPLATGFGRPLPDYKGNFYVHTAPGNAGATQTTRIIVFQSEAANANVGAANTTNPTRTGAAALNNDQYGWWRDPNSDRLFLFTNLAGTGYIHEYGNVVNTNTWTVIANLSTGAWTPTSVQSNMTYANSPAVTGTWDLRGDLVFMPRRGFLTITNMRVGANQTSQTSYHAVVSMNHPDSTFGTGYPFNWGNQQSNDIVSGAANGWATHQWTNGIRIFQSFWRSNTEQRITTISNLYPNTQFNTFATGRLLVKA